MVLKLYYTGPDDSYDRIYDVYNPDPEDARKIYIAKNFKYVGGFKNEPFISGLDDTTSKLIARIKQIDKADIVIVNLIGAPSERVVADMLYAASRPHTHLFLFREPKISDDLFYAIRMVHSMSPIAQTLYARNTDDVFEHLKAIADAKFEVPDHKRRGRK